MNTPKPRIRPKADAYRQRSERPLSDPPSFPQWDPPVFSERDPGTDKRTDEGVVFRENDCLG